MQSVNNIQFFLTVIFSKSFFSMLTAPYWVIYFNQIGLSFQSISTLVIVNHIASLVFEIPTGAVADVYGRKVSVLISLFIGTIVYAIIFFTGSLKWLLLAYILSGFGATFMSGAFEAWFADSFPLHKEVDLTNLWGRYTSFSYAGNGVGFLVAAILSHFLSLKTFWLIQSLGISFIFLYVLIKGKETVDRSKGQKDASYKEFTTKMFRGSTFIFTHIVLLIPVVGSCLFYFSSGIISLGWQPFLKIYGVRTEFLGIILALNMGFSIITPNLVGRLVKKMRGELSVLSPICLVIALLIGGMTIWPDLSFILFILYGGIYSLESPLFKGYINKVIPSSERATILSTYSVFVSLATIFATFVFGYISDNFSLSIAFFISSVFAVIAALGFIVSKRVKLNES